MSSNSDRWDVDREAELESMKQIFDIDESEFERQNPQPDAIDGLELDKKPTQFQRDLSNSDRLHRIEKKLDRLLDHLGVDDE